MQENLRNTRFSLCTTAASSLNAAAALTNQKLFMAKALSKSQIAATIAEKVGTHQEAGRGEPGSVGGTGLQERQELFHDSRPWQNRSGEPESPHGTQPGDWGDHQDCCQARGEVPRGQSCQGRDPGQEVISDRKLKGHSDGVRVPLRLLELIELTRSLRSSRAARLACARLQRSIFNCQIVRFPRTPKSSLTRISFNMRLDPLQQFAKLHNQLRKREASLKAG